MHSIGTTSARSQSIARPAQVRVKDAQRLGELG